MALPFIRSKIICTIGPASSDPKTMDAMIEAGMDVARINMSHGTQEEHRAVIKHIMDHGECGVLVDLPGPKIRLGQLEAPVELVEGQD
ncbi:pyruvate kinase, partial [Candidatus Bathyarchaeota archaeon]|nr:pyruvate kinase [Candidatus Bathyarchaeota archaeon]